MRILILILEKENLAVKENEMSENKNIGPEMVIYFDKSGGKTLSPQDIVFFALIQMDLENHIKIHRLDQMFGENNKNKIIKN